MIEMFKIMAGIYDNEVTPKIPKGHEHIRDTRERFLLEA